MPPADGEGPFRKGASVTGVAVRRIFAMGVLVGLFAFSVVSSQAAAEGGPIPKRAFAEVAEALKSPPGREGHDEKVRRYSRAIRTARSYALQYADAPNLHQLHGMMLVALQARLNLEADIETYRMLLGTAKKILNSDAPKGDKLEADLVLLRDKLRETEKNSGNSRDDDTDVSYAEWHRTKGDSGSEAKLRSAILNFISRYHGTHAAEKALMYGGMMAEDKGDMELLTILTTELRERPGSFDQPGILNFLLHHSGLNLSGGSFNATMNLLDGGRLRAPADLLGKLTVFLFWSVHEAASTDGIGQLDEFYEQQKHRLNLVGVPLDKSRPDVVRFVRGEKLDWTHVFSGRGPQDPVAWQCGVSGLPSAQILGPAGRTRHMKGDYGWYASMSSSTEIRSYQGLIDVAIKDLRWFENFSNVCWNYLSGEFLIRMKTDLFGGKGDGSAGIPGAARAKLLSLIHDIRNHSEGEDKMLSARKALDLVHDLEEQHADADNLYAVRNCGIIAARTLWIHGGDAAHRRDALRLANAVAQNRRPSPPAMLADYCLVSRELRSKKTDASRQEGHITDFIDRYEDTPARTAATILGALLAVETGHDGLMHTLGESLEKGHAESPQARSFLRYILERYVDRGKPFEAHLKRLDGTPVSLPDDFLGKPLVVCFWTADALRRHADMPEPAGRRWRRPPYTGLSPDEHPDLAILGINLDDSIEAARELMDGKLAGWIHTRPAAGWRNELVERLDIQSLPSTWIIDRDGIIAADDMLAAHLRSPILAAAMHQPAARRIRDRMVNQWRVLGPFHQRTSNLYTETGYTSAAPCLQTTRGRKAWFGIQAWHRWPFSQLERRYMGRFSDGHFPPARAEREIDFDASYDDGGGKQVGWRAAQTDRLGFLDLDRIYPERPAPAIAYAVTYVHSQTGGTYHATLTNTYDLTLRVNGEEMLRLMAKVRDDNNHQAPVWWAGQTMDREWANRYQGTSATMPREEKQLLRRDALTLHLRKGWNEVFLKTTDARGRWRFQLRIADPDRTLQYALSPEEPPDDDAGTRTTRNPPDADDALGQVLEMVDGPHARKAVAAAGAHGKISKHAGIKEEFARCIDGLNLMELMHSLDLWAPNSHIAEQHPDADTMELVLEFLQPETITKHLAEALQRNRTAGKSPDIDHHRRKRLAQELRGIVHALGVVGSEQAVRLLLDLFEAQTRLREEGKGNVPLLRALTDAAGEAGSPAFLEHLEPLLDSENKHLRQAAVRAMVNIDGAGERCGDKLIELIDEKGWRARHYLANIQTPEARTFIETSMGDSASQGEDIFCIRAVNTAAAYDSPDVVDEVAAALLHRHMRVRIAGMQALGRLGHKNATPALLEAFAKPSNRELRHYIAAALAKIGDPRGEDILAQLLDSKAYSLRILASRGLGATGAGEASVKKLIEALDDPHWLVRTSAAESLGALRAEGAAASLKDKLDDSHSSVRAAAAAALEKLR